MTIENYHGREQSHIKHLFLTDYLRTAAYKILQGRSPKFNFVDAFAGPWKVSDSDYSDAFFFKQWGGARPKSGGRLLDGEELNGFPWHVVPPGILESLRRPASNLPRRNRHGRESSRIGRSS